MSVSTNASFRPWATGPGSPQAAPAPAAAAIFPRQPASPRPGLGDGDRARPIREAAPARRGVGGAWAGRRTWAGRGAGRGRDAPLSAVPALREAARGRRRAFPAGTAR